MIYFFQRHFGDQNVKIIRASMVGYMLLGLIVMMIMELYINDGRALYHEFYRSWKIACTGMFLALVSVIEFGVMLVIIIGKEGKVKKSLPRMLPQCGVMVLIILINIFALKNPNQFRQLNKDLMRVQDNDPVVEDVTALYICAVLRWTGPTRHSGSYFERWDSERWDSERWDSGRRHPQWRHSFDYFLEFGDKHVDISEEMYNSIYEKIDRYPDGIHTYDKRVAGGEYQVTYLPNTMMVLDVTVIKN